jgi:peptidoglycan/xylan/chitin deacetylase (PgdA/CDA1 family)
MSGHKSHVDPAPPPHGIMFHHFWNDRHPRGQGAMTAEELESIITFVGRDRILPSTEWQSRAETGTLQDEDICFTFDDNLRCQFDVALPVLRRHGITAFWFVYTSVFDGALERLELYRLFRTLHFPTMERFYDAFWAQLSASPYAAEVRAKLTTFVPADHLRDFPFYTDADRTFRFVRDELLGETRYCAVMDQMMAEAGADADKLAEGLWMDAEMLRALRDDGHVIGLHSHSHPTRLGELSAEQQRQQYETNQQVLTGILQQRPTTVSHPCNSYSEQTIEILKSLGIRLGFRANRVTSEPGSYGPLEHPREDHANLLRRIIA